MSAPGASAAFSGLTTTAALTRRELVRILRQPSRLMASIGTPLLLWVLLGSGFARSFRAPAGDPAAADAGYGLYLLPGMLTMAVLFSSIFGAMSLIQDRNEGFLQSVLVSPAPRLAIAASKLLGSALIATLQAAILLPAAFFLSDDVSAMGLALSVFGLLCVALGIAGLGLAAAWWVDSVQGFHGVMNLVLFPMWLLSGALFPLEGASGWLRTVMMLNPVTWSTRALHHSLGYLEGPGTLPWAITIAFAAAGVVLGWITLGRGIRRL